MYVIEGEWFEPSKNTKEIAEEIKKLEDSIFPNNRMYLRFSDTDPRLISDLSTLHDLEFGRTRKDNKDAQVNYVRNMVASSRLFIHPRCVNLARQLRIGIWNEQKTKFARANMEGHFDLIDALVYLLRNIDIYDNPYPHKYAGITAENHFVEPFSELSQEEEVLREAFGG